MTKEAREQYINKVKMGIDVYKRMKEMKDNEQFLISYKDKTYDIHCSYNKRSDGLESRVYSIGEDSLFGRRMNIDMEKSGKSYLFCFTYDLFRNMSSKKLDFSEIEFVNE